MSAVGIALGVSPAQVHSLLGEPKTKEPGLWSYLHESKETFNNEALDLI